MKLSRVLSLSAATLFVFTGCNSFPGAYQGHFEGSEPSTAAPVTMEITSDAVTLTLDGKTQSYTSTIEGFDDSISAVLQGSGGLYVLPVTESMQGIPMGSPWGPRAIWSSMFGWYQDGTVESKRYIDVYAVLPISGSSSGGDIGGVSPVPASGGVNNFDADILYVRMDKQAQTPMSSLNAQVVRKGSLGAENVSIMGVATIKMLSIAPDTNIRPEALELLRK